MEAFEIINYLSEFSSLNAAQLEEEIETCTEKIDEIEKELEHKLKVVQLLDEEISELKPIVDDLEVKSEKLEVEQIRVTTHSKKTKKDITKMNVDPSRATLDATDNDKQKLAILKAKLSLLRKLLNTFVNSDSQGFAFNPREMQLQLFQLNVNKPIEENRESLWNCIGNCSEHLDSWELLFQK